MADALTAYMAFIDGLLTWPLASVRARWVREWDELEAQKTYRVPVADKLREIVPGLSHHQREVLAALLEEERAGAIHDVLAYLEPYTLSERGVPLAREPFGTQMHYDFVARQAGRSWPKEPVLDG